MEIVRKAPRGGHNPSLIALGVLGVMMMAAVIGMVAMDDEEVADAAIGDTFFCDFLEYEVIADGEVEWIGWEVFAGEFELPSMVSDGTTIYKVVSVGDWVFGNNTYVTSITIPDTVISIGRCSFTGCKALESVTLSDNLESIGDSAFFGCNLLSSITIPDSVKSIGNGAFEYCESLTSISIPSSVTSIGDEAFAKCTGLTSVTFSDGVTSIGNYATFEDCTGLTSVLIPGSVSSIGSFAFYECTGLTSVTFSNGVSSIGSASFAYCTGLTSISFPESVTYYGDSAFEGCNNLTSIIFESQESPSNLWEDSYCFNTGTTLNIYTPGWDPSYIGFTVDSDVTTIVWANPPPAYPDLTFLSNPVTNGTLAYNPLRTSKTALTA